MESMYGIEDQVYNNRVLIHSGYGGTILLDDQFVQAHQIGNQLEVISENQLKDSHGNIIKTKKAILPQLTIGKHRFTDVPIGFFAGALGKQRISVLGCGLLKRFNILIDQKNDLLYLQPNQFVDHPFGNS